MLRQLGPHLRTALRPWAELLESVLARVPLASGVGSHALLCVLCSILTLTTLRVILDVLRFLHNASVEPQDTLGFLTHHLFRVCCHIVVQPPVRAPT
jgi:hypothetical protein